ncbi:MAG: hypothetical protein LBK29_02820 [Oscillospiraceae bacterium]|jgi:hypothetical protein|nr:hypothetical protein [Oscillospiraceae bacterium]
MIGDTVFDLKLLREVFMFLRNLGISMAILCVATPISAQTHSFGTYDPNAILRAASKFRNLLRDAGYDRDGQYFSLYYGISEIIRIASEELSEAEASTPPLPSEVLPRYFENLCSITVFHSKMAPGYTYDLFAGLLRNIWSAAGVSRDEELVGKDTEYLRDWVDQQVIEDGSAAPHLRGDIQNFTPSEDKWKMRVVGPLTYISLSVKVVEPQEDLVASVLEPALNRLNIIYYKSNEKVKSPDYVALAILKEDFGLLRVLSPSECQGKLSDLKIPPQCFLAAIKKDRDFIIASTYCYFTGEKLPGGFDARQIDARLHLLTKKEMDEFPKNEEEMVNFPVKFQFGEEIEERQLSLKVKDLGEESEICFKRFVTSLGYEAPKHILCCSSSNSIIDPTVPIAKHFLKFRKDGECVCIKLGNDQETLNQTVVSTVSSTEYGGKGQELEMFRFFLKTKDSGTRLHRFPYSDIRLKCDTKSFLKRLFPGENDLKVVINGKIVPDSTLLKSVFEVILQDDMVQVERKEETCRFVFYRDGAFLEDNDALDDCILTEAEFRGKTVQEVIDIINFKSHLEVKGLCVDGGNIFVEDNFHDYYMPGTIFVASLDDTVPSSTELLEKEGKGEEDEFSLWAFDSVRFVPPIVIAPLDDDLYD